MHLQIFARSKHQDWYGSTYWYKIFLLFFPCFQSPPSYNKMPLREASWELGYRLIMIFRKDAVCGDSKHHPELNSDQLIEGRYSWRWLRATWCYQHISLRPTLLTPNGTEVRIKRIHLHSPAPLFVLKTFHRWDRNACAWNCDEQWIPHSKDALHTGCFQTICLLLCHTLPRHPPRRPNLIKHECGKNRFQKRLICESVKRKRWSHRVTQSLTLQNWPMSEPSIIHQDGREGATATLNLIILSNSSSILPAVSVRQSP